MGAHKDLIRQLERSGCTIEVSGSNHLKVRRHNGSYAMTMSLTPGDKNAGNKARQLAVRLGLLAE